jgi:hypothetical protein
MTVVRADALSAVATYFTNSTACQAFGMSNALKPSNHPINADASNRCAVLPAQVIETR